MIKTIHELIEIIRDMIETIRELSLRRFPKNSKP